MVRMQAFEVVFLMDGIQHRYGFELNNERVTAEWLFRKRSREIKVFEFDDMFDVLMAFLQDAYDRASFLLTMKKKQRIEYQSITTVHRVVHSINGMTTTAEKHKAKKEADSKAKVR